MSWKIYISLVNFLQMYYNLLETKNNNLVTNFEKRLFSVAIFVHKISESDIGIALRFSFFSNEVEFWPDLKTLLATLVFIFENFEIFKGHWVRIWLIQRTENVSPRCKILIEWNLPPEVVAESEANTLLDSVRKIRLSKVVFGNKFVNNWVFSCWNCWWW